MNLVDVVIVAWAVLAAVGGYRRGAVLQLTEYMGLLIGLLAGALVAPKIAGLAGSPVTRSTIALVVLLGFAGLGEAAGWFIGKRAWTATRRTRLGSVDSAGGSVVSVAAVLLVVWFVAFSLSTGPFPTLARQIRSSAIVTALNGALPQPPSLLAEVRQLLDRFGFPEVFAGLPPAPAGPVKDPTTAQAQAIEARAGASTVRVVGQACGSILSGTGFVVAPHYVVTNAHVLAGVTTPQVQFPTAGSEEATPVLFDPNLDVAVLYVATTPAPVLRLDPDDVGRGTQGAVIGYPGGGPEISGPAAVRRELPAVGRDIYGVATVTRNIYELQAEVRPGDSGGPFVLPNGTVAGMVFAASTTDPAIGYALTSGEVLDRLNQAVGRRAPVSTAGCTR